MQGTEKPLKPVQTARECIATRTLMASDSSSVRSIWIQEPKHVIKVVSIISSAMLASRDKPRPSVTGKDVHWHTQLGIPEGKGLTSIRIHYLREVLTGWGGGGGESCAIP